MTKRLLPLILVCTVAIWLVAEGAFIYSHRATLTARAADVYGWLMTHVPQPSVHRAGPMAADLARNPWLESNNLTPHAQTERAAR
jgi:hypothetical protein